MIARAVAAALLWILATPPAFWPGLEWLILPALALLYEVSLRAARPYRLAYAIGLAHVLAFSASLRHLAWIAYVAIGLLGAVYVVLLAACTRWVAPRLGGPLAFGLAVAATHWLRAHMPEIPYPHGQPVHCLYEWPSVLGCVAWGGEPLGNLLVAGLAAAAVELSRAWRLAAAPWSRSIAVAAGFGTLLLLPAFRPAARTGPHALHIVAIEPGFAPMFRSRVDAAEAYDVHLFEPTRAVAAPGMAEAPDLVIWPESGFRDPVIGDGRGLVLTGPGGPRLASGTMLIANTFAELPDEIRLANILLDSYGRLAGLQWKRRLVPGGEYVPFLAWLPRSWSRGLFAFFSGMTGEPPNLRPGGQAPPLRVRTRAGQEVSVGTLVCFENAFPDLAREQVEGGANLIVVLSNETWYRGGAELAQMVAMTVCRALETATPIVRATVDGITVWVDGDGLLRDRLPLRGREDRAPRRLAVAVPVGPGRMPSMAWLARGMPWIVFGAILCALAAHALSWARLIAVRQGEPRPQSGA